MKHSILIAGLLNSFLVLTACSSSSSENSIVKDESDSSLSESSAKEILSWTDWQDGATEFNATTVYGDASGIATFDGGDFTPTQSSYIQSMQDDDGNSYIGQSYNESYYIDFEFTVDSSYTELTEFSFDAYVNNSDDAQLNWTLSVEASNNTSENAATEGIFPETEITLGTVDRLQMDADEDGWQSLSFDLSTLADHDAGANGSVILRLYAWGGTADSTETHMTAIDNVVIRAVEPDAIEEERPGLGERADWLRGSWGIMWKPDNLYNGYIENDIAIDDFIEQIEGIKTIDYSMVLLTGANIYSPIHTAPNDILESLWGEDAVTDEDFTIGSTYNLVVPRKTSGKDPFKDWLEAIRAAGMKSMVYVNSSNMLYRYDTDNPDEFPDITERWKAYCDENEAVQAFLDSKPYYRTTEYDDDYGYREYMFCYAEFILRDYAKTYGDLIDAWIFDSASYISDAGETNSTGILEDQRLFQAFAEAVRAGNPDVPASFNNGTGSVLESRSPIYRPTLFDDYSFGHPFGGGNYIGGEDDDYGPGDDDYDSSRMYDKNYRIIEFMYATDGNVFDLDEELDYFAISYYDLWSWDDKVVGHFYPPMATLNWNSGSTAALTDEHFTLWNTTAMTGGGAISWGGPLNGKKATNANFDPTLTDWALSQLTVMDESLMENEKPNEPNWYRAETILVNGSVGTTYEDWLTEEQDFWYPGGDAGSISGLSIVDDSGAPDWLIIKQTETVPATFRLKGTPTQAGDYKFDLQLTAFDDSTSTRTVTLTVE
jgi:hypothetical protein